MAYETIRYETAEQILTITLNRPEKLNVFSPTMHRELRDAFERVDNDDDIRAVIVTGAGRAFCAGADLSQGADMSDIDPQREPTKKLVDGVVNYGDPSIRDIDRGGQLHCEYSNA